MINVKYVLSFKWIMEKVEIFRVFYRFFGILFDEIINLIFI